jgi:hypothetical protein
MEQRKRAQRAFEREAWDKVRRWEAVVNALGAKLFRTSDNAQEGGAITRAFHAACEKLNMAEVEALEASNVRVAA